jgi:tetratricopeptide (TPR) repeat protein
MPASPPLSSPHSRTPRPAPPNPRWFPWKSILLVSGLLLGVYAVLETPREISRWQMASANEYWREAEYGVIQGNLALVADNRQKAFAKLEDALSWSPEEPLWLQQRAQWKADIGQHEDALRDCNRLLEKDENAVELLQLRTRIHHWMGSHAQAVADAERVNNLSQTSGNPSRANALNGLAYAKAIGKIDLDLALQEINEALKSDKNAAYLDTRGFIYYQMGKYDLALKDLGPAAEEIRRVLALQIEESAFERRTVPDVRKMEIKAKKWNEPAAVILYHRALAHEKLGHAAAAKADRKRVRELIGREGDEKLF